MNKNFIKLIISFSIIVLVIQSPTSAFAITAREAELNKQKQTLAAQQEAAKKAAEQKSAEAAKFQTQIDAADRKISETEDALQNTDQNITAAEENISNLAVKIKTEEDNLNTEDKKLNDILSSWYMEGETTLLDTVLDSDNLSQMMDKHEYYDSVKQQLLNSIDRINKIKEDLLAQKTEQQNKKTELENLKKEQIAYKQSVETQRNAKDSLLDMTLSQRSDYLKKVAQLEGEIDKVSDEIYAERLKAKRGSEVWVYGTSAYPFTSIDQPDPWGFLTRECTSYAAWYWNIKLGRSWYRGEGPSGTGHAYNWPSLASRNGVSSHSSPEVGAIISWQKSSKMPYGHVAIVEKVNGDGTIDVSEYNWVKYAYSYRRNVDPSYYGGYSYIY